MTEVDADLLDRGSNEESQDEEMQNHDLSTSRSQLSCKDADAVFLIFLAMTLKWGLGFLMA